MTLLVRKRALSVVDRHARAHVGLYRGEPLAGANPAGIMES